MPYDPEKNPYKDWPVEKLLAEIRRLDRLTFADAVEFDNPELAEKLRKENG